MSFAEDTSRVRREIEEMRSSRIAFNQRLNRFAADLRRSMNERRASMRKHNSEQAASTKAALASFVVHARRMMHETLVGFQRERSAAHRAWLRMGRISRDRPPCGGGEYGGKSHDRGEPHGGNGPLNGVGAFSWSRAFGGVGACGRVRRTQGGMSRAAARGR